MSRRRNSGAAPGAKHFHCRYCAKVYEREARIASREITHAGYSRGRKSHARLYGMPSINRSAQRYADLIIKPEAPRRDVSLPRRDMIRWPFGIRGPYAIPGDVHILPTWRIISKTKDFLIDACGAPKLVLAYDVTASFRVFRIKNAADIRQVAASKGISTIPALGFYSPICDARVVHFHGFVSTGVSQDVSTTIMEFVRARIHISGAATGGAYVRLRNRRSSNNRCT